MKNTNTVGLATLSLVASVLAVPTWPSNIDEIEDILFLNSGHNAREFPQLVQPCTTVKSPGHSIAGGMIRVAFHDMTGFNAAAGTGGLDASVGFELDSATFPTNTGIAFNNSLQYYSQYFNSRASMSDLIAVGMTQAVRACGGPIVPARAGRIDAVQAGTFHVPQPTDSSSKMTSAFAFWGFSVEDMITMTACGHTIGGVHSQEHPDIVPAGTTELGVQNLDSTNATFDNGIVTEYVAGTSQNPLISGANVTTRSDDRVFSTDNRATISTLTDPAAFATKCANILARMVDSVPSTVTLSDVIAPYALKPYNLQLEVSADGNSLTFTGELRLLTNSLPSSTISSVQLVYTDRTGAAGTNNTISAFNSGDASGFDDTFSFFSFSATIPASTSISSFTVVVTTSSGATQTFDNNGSGYPVSDLVFVQSSFSSQSTIVAAVRTTETSGGVNLNVETVTPMTFNDLPTLSVAPTAMTSVCVGPFYTLYTATVPSPGVSVNSTKFGVLTTATSGTVQDGFNSLAALPVTASLTPTCVPVVRRRDADFSARRERAVRSRM